MKRLGGLGGLGGEQLMGAGSHAMTGWWFGTFGLFFHIELIFFRGVG